MTRLIYTDKICAQEDARLANEINQRIEKVSSMETFPIVPVCATNTVIRELAITAAIICRLVLHGAEKSVSTPKNSSNTLVYCWKKR